MKCDQEPSTLDVANALIKRCQSPALIVTATPKGSKGSLARGAPANLGIQGQFRAFREAVSMKYKTNVGQDHVLMGWMVRHCAWVVNNFQVKGTGRTPCRPIRGNDYTGAVVPFGEVCLARNHSEDRAKLNMRWMRGVFVGKLDRTDEFLLLTPTGAMKTRCFKRLEGDNAWDLQFLNFKSVCWQSVECESKEHAGETNNPTEGRVGSGRRAKIVYLRPNMLDKYGRTAGCAGCVGNGQHTEECRARIEQEMVDKGDPIKLETCGNQEEIVPEPDVSLKKRKIG